MANKKKCRFCGASSVFTPGMFCVNCGALHEPIEVDSEPTNHRAALDSKTCDYGVRSEELKMAESVLNDVDALIGRVEGGDDSVSVENLLLIRLGISALIGHLRRY
ncbi:MAG: hypothetical protein ACXVIX_11160 [Halobacteriota archaeon]